MKRVLPFLIVGVVALITFGSGFAFYRLKKASAPSDLTVASGGATGIHVRGKADAAVTIEEFGDFQCPPCAMMSTQLHKFEAEYGSRLRVIFHQFPLAMHEHAREAALASEAAHEQGKFWEMHDVLYKEQTLWSKAPDVPALFNGYAQSIGLDVERFKKDMTEREVAERVEEDQKLGASRGVTSTPTLFVNNTLVPGNQLAPDALKKVIETALNGNEKEKEKR